MSTTELFTSHYDLLRRYLASFLQEQAAQLGRTNAKDKLARLSAPQFVELSIDVFDETNRRLKGNPDVPFLAVMSNFTPKRNQARQKLATLQTFRFKELASEVFFELERRFPQIVERYDARYGRPQQAPPARDELLEAMRARPTRELAGNSGYGNLAPPPRLAQPPVPSSSTTRQVPTRGASRNVAQGNAPPPSREQVRGDVESRLRTASQTDTRERDRGRGEWERRPSAGEASRERERERRLDVTNPSISSSPALDTRERDPRLRERRPSESQYDTSARSEASVRSASRGPDREEIERLKSKYEGEIVVLRRELDDRPTKADLARLEDDLAAERKTARETKAKYDELLYDFEGLQEDNRKQREAAEEEQRKATDLLLQDVRALTQKAQKLTEEKDRSADTIRQLREELERITSETQSLASTPRTRNDSAKGDLFLTIDDNNGSGNGVDPRVLAFQDAAERLVSASRDTSKSQPTNLIVAMKAVILAVKPITEESSQLERSTRDADGADDLADARGRLSDDLSDLMRLAKDQAAGYGGQNASSAFEDRVRTIDDSVRDLVDLMRRVRDPLPAPSSAASTLPRTTLGRTLPRANNPRVSSSIGGGPIPSDEPAPLDPPALKLFVEDTADLIVSDIQQLLPSLKQSQPSATLDTLADIEQCVEDILLESNRTLPMLDSDTRPQAGVILEVLSAAMDKLRSARDDYATDSSNRAGKQRIANTSYEVAKHVKDLLSLFE
ncbi:hypothetical protein HKX48_001779 [Thoreauomyces humboldtii]|nr:hypothetical protein HKX48_001779 [Thoreauomyces humboldtii]